MIRDESNIKISIRMPKRLYDCLVEYAEDHGWSISLAIKMILRKYFGI